MNAIVYDMNGSYSANFRQTATYTKLNNAPAMRSLHELHIKPANKNNNTYSMLVFM